MSKTNSAPRAVLAEQIAAYIDLHFCEPALTLGKLSGIFHFNANYISYTFKEYVGTGVSRYIAKKRMEKACGLLTKTQMAVKEIAEECGYTDALYFERVFKRHTGESPTAYRAQGERTKKSPVFDAFTKSFYR